MRDMLLMPLLLIGASEAGQQGLGPPCPPLPSALLFSTLNYT